MTVTSPLDPRETIAPSRRDLEPTVSPQPPDGPKASGVTVFSSLLKNLDRALAKPAPTGIGLQDPSPHPRNNPRSHITDPTEMAFPAAALPAGGEQIERRLAEPLRYLRGTTPAKYPGDELPESRFRVKALQAGRIRPPQDLPIGEVEEFVKDGIRNILYNTEQEGVPRRNPETTAVYTSMNAHTTRLLLDVGFSTSTAGVEAAAKQANTRNFQREIESRHRLDAASREPLVHKLAEVFRVEDGLEDYARRAGERGTAAMTQLRRRNAQLACVEVALDSASALLEPDVAGSLATCGPLDHFNRPDFDKRREKWNNYRPEEINEPRELQARAVAAGLVRVERLSQLTRLASTATAEGMPPQMRLMDLASLETSRRHLETALARIEPPQDRRFSAAVASYQENTEEQMEHLAQLMREEPHIGSRVLKGYLRIDGMRW